MNISWKKSVELSAVYCVGKLFLADAKVAKKQPHLDELAKCEAPKDAGDWRNCLDSISARESESVNLGDFSTDVESCTSAFEKCFPKFNDEIKIRSQPLQSMFAFEGPGLFRLTCQLAGLKPPEHATVWLAQPVSAGGGISLLPNALGPQAIIEAVLTHVDPRLPESLRIAWLLTRSVGRQTGVAVSDSTRSISASLDNGSALLAVVLRAAAELELLELNEAVIALAQELWAGDLVGELHARPRAADLLDFATQL